MAELSKDTAISGIEDYFPESSKEGAIELARRLERFMASLMYQLTSQPTGYTNSVLDPPEGAKFGDYWIWPDGSAHIYNGSEWTP